MENLRHNSNPYQNSSPVSHRSQYGHHSPQPIQNPLANPYMNQALRSNQSGMSPQFNRSHTWHGNDLSTTQPQQGRDRERDNRGSRDNRGHGHDNKEQYDRNRDRGHSHRDRSGSRQRGDRVEDYRNSPSNDNYNGAENFESRRQNVLDKQNRPIQGHQRGSRHEGGRSGRY